MGSITFLKVCLGWIGGIAAAAAVVSIVLEIGQSRVGNRPGRLGQAWAKIAATPWSRLTRRATAAILNLFNRAIDRGFTRADETIIGNVVFIGLVFVALPGLSLLNVLVGGSPRLALYCLSLVAVLVVLNFTAERGRLGGFNALAALYLGVGFKFGIPLYVLRSFSDRLLKEAIDHAVIESLMVAPLVFIIVHAGFTLFGTIAGRRTEAAVVVDPVAGLAAALPVTFVLTFVALFLGATAEAPESLGQSWALLFAAMACGAAALPVTLAVLGAALRSTTPGAVIGALLAALAVAWALAAALWLGAYGPEMLSFEALATVMVGFHPTSGHLFLGPEFWILNLPFLPAVAVVGGLVAAVYLKAIASLVDRVTGPAMAAKHPLGAMGLGLAVAATVTIYGSLWL